LETIFIFIHNFICNQNVDFVTKTFRFSEKILIFLLKISICHLKIILFYTLVSEKSDKSSDKNPIPASRCRPRRSFQNPHDLDDSSIYCQTCRTVQTPEQFGNHLCVEKDPDLSKFTFIRPAKVIMGNSYRSFDYFERKNREKERSVRRRQWKTENKKSGKIVEAFLHDDKSAASVGEYHAFLKR